MKKKFDKVLLCADGASHQIQHIAFILIHSLSVHTIKFFLSFILRFSHLFAPRVNIRTPSAFSNIIHNIRPIEFPIPIQWIFPNSHGTFEASKSSAATFPLLLFIYHQSPSLNFFLRHLLYCCASVCVCIFMYCNMISLMISYRVIIFVGINRNYCVYILISNTHIQIHVPRDTVETESEFYCYYKGIRTNIL